MSKLSVVNRTSNMKLLVFCFIFPLANSNQINFANLGSVRIVDGYLHIQSGFPLDSLHENRRIIVPQIHKVTKCDIVILHLCFVLKVQQIFIIAWYLGSRVPVSLQSRTSGGAQTILSQHPPPIWALWIQPQRNHWRPISQWQVKTRFDLGSSRWSITWNRIVRYVWDKPTQANRK